MKTISLMLISTVALASGSYAAITVNTINFSDDQNWPNYPAQADGQEPRGSYDSRALNIQNADGLEVESVRIILDTSGIFDDSIAMDIDADGTIDFLSTQGDAYATSGIGNSGANAYRPWVDASPYVFDAEITATGTSLRAFWGGVEINVGSAGGNDAGFNNIANFTLADWGFGAGGTIIGDNFTTSNIRLGNINTDGVGAHDIAFTFDAIVIEDTEGNVSVFDPDGDGVPSAVPEVSSFALLAGIFALAGVVSRRRLSC